MCLVYLLLHRHIKIVKLSKQQVVSVAEFEDMRETWEYLFEAFNNRMDALVEIWRHQRIQISDQMESFAGGMFKDCYERVSLCLR